MNLYGFGGGDPVNFNDPFGLYAMDVEYKDQQSKEEVEVLRKRSKTFDKAMQVLEDDHSVLVTIGHESTAGCGGSGGCAIPAAQRNARGQRVFSVRLDNGGIVSDYQVQKGYGGADVSTVLAHEVYGHVVPWSRGQACGDALGGTPAAGVCSVRRENVIRGEMGFPIRTKY